MQHDHNKKLKTALFIGLFLCTGLPQVASPLALVAGFLFCFFFGNPLPELTAKTSKVLLKLSVVGLGFGVNIGEVIELGKSSVLMTLVFIVATVGLGNLLGQVMGITANTRMLLSFGTAICGGSAIAAMAPVLKAKDEEVAVSLATVFALNAAALLIFPALGKAFQLSQHQFGLWSALAIHDTSSVVGASATFGAAALTVGTTTKLTRALWIAPCTLAASLFCKSERKFEIPFFIIGFIVAAFVHSWLPEFDQVWNNLYTVAKQALVMTLFLIGAGLTRKVLKQVGLRPLLLGSVLWIVVSITSLGLIMSGHVN